MGLFWALGLFFTSVSEALLTNQQGNLLRRLQLVVNTSLLTTLYDKLLRISATARDDLGVGKIVNHVSNDARKLTTVANDLHSMWSAPLEVAVYIAMLTNFIGLLPALVGPPCHPISVPSPAV